MRQRACWVVVLKGQMPCQCFIVSLIVPTWEKKKLSPPPSFYEIDKHPQLCSFFFFSLGTLKDYEALHVAQLDLPAESSKPTKKAKQKEKRKLGWLNTHTNRANTKEVPLVFSCQFNVLPFGALAQNQCKVIEKQARGDGNSLQCRMGDIPCHTHWGAAPLATETNTSALAAIN